MNMHFSLNCFRHRQIIFVNEESFGVTFTHYNEKWSSRTLRWADVRAMDAMQLASGNVGLVVRTANGQPSFISANSENWSLLEEAIRTRYPNFDWENFQNAKDNQDDLSKSFRCWGRPSQEISKTIAPIEANPPRSNSNSCQKGQVIFVNDESFGVTVTHWFGRRKRLSWSLRWEDVLAIDAMRIEPGYIGFVFLNTENQWRFLVEDMENWSALEKAVRSRYPDLNWENFELAKNYVETRVPCWKRKNTEATRGKLTNMATDPKRVFMILLCAFFLAQTTAKAADDVPSVVISGLNTYRTNSLKAAYEIWSRGTLENDKASREAAVSGLTQVESIYGKMTGYDIVKVVPVGAVVKRIYFVVHYEKGPVYAYFDCYNTGEKWVVTDLLFHTKANLVFPASLLGG